VARDRIEEKGASSVEIAQLHVPVPRKRREGSGGVPWLYFFWKSAKIFFQLVK